MLFFDKKTKPTNTKLWMAIIIFAVFAIFQTTSAATGLNKQVNYQAKLTNALGVSVPNGNYDVVFKIYDAASAGTTLWTGTYTTANGNPIVVANGVFNILLGSGTGNTLNLDFSTDSYYLGVQIGADAEMTPRKRLGAVPQAFNANNLIGDGFIKLTGTPTGNAVDQGTIYINPSSATAGYTLLGLAINGAQKFKVDEAGNVTQTGNITVNGTGDSTFAGNLRLNGILYDSSADAGISGQILSSTATGTNWINTPSNMVMSGTITGATAGSILFAGTAGILTQDNANFFWDDTNNRLGIGTIVPAAKLDVRGNILLPQYSSIGISVGNTKGYLWGHHDATFDGYPFNDDIVLSTNWHGESGTLAIDNTASFLSNSGIAVGRINGVRFFTSDSGAVNPIQRMVISRAGNVGIGTTTPGQKLSIAGAFSGVPLGGSNAGVEDRPGVRISGNYPEIVVMGGVANGNHGATISLAGFDSGTTGAFKSWTMGTAGNNATFLDIGYGTSVNPHLNGIRGYGTTVMTLLNSGNVGIGTLSPAEKLDVAGVARFGVGTSTSIKLEDDESPNGIKYIHANSNNIGFLSGAGSWIARWDEAGTMVTGNMYAPIFYDSNNSGYYVNPDSMSQMERVDFSYGYDRNNGGYYIDLDNRTNLLHLTANGDIRSPIFYDQNDLSYYADPSWHSNLNKGSFNELSAVRLGTGGYNATAGYPSGWLGGIHAGDIYSEMTIGLGPGGGLNLYINASGAALKPGGGTWGTISDSRLKKDIVSFDDGLDELLQINPVRFRYNADSGYSDLDKEYVGVIAQDVMGFIPYTVSSHERIINGETVDRYEFDASALQYIIINAIQDQQSEIINSKLEISNLVLKTDADVINLQQLQSSIDTQLGVVQASLTALATADTQQAAQLTTLEASVTQHEARLVNLETLTITLQGQLEALQLDSAQNTLDITDAQLAMTNLEILLDVRIDKTDFNLGHFVVENLETGLLTIKVVDAQAATIGTATIPAGETSVMVPTTAVSSGTKVFVTPKNVTDKVLAVTTATAGESFRVEIKDVDMDAIEFDWWIVERN